MYILLNLMLINEHEQQLMIWTSHMMLLRIYQIVHLQENTIHLVDGIQRLMVVAQDIIHENL